VIESAAEVQAAHRVAATFEQVFTVIRSWRAAIESAVRDAAAEVHAAQLDGLVERLVAPVLSLEAALIIGAGFVARPGFLRDARWHLAWWLGHANTFGSDRGLRRLAAVEDEESESFRDYTRLEWWRVPALTGTPHITGPYVDYLCTDDYTLTLTMPVHSPDGTLAGMTGADLYVRDVERMLLPVVRSAGAGAMLVNAAGRVVVAADGTTATGSLVRIGDLRERLSGGVASVSADGHRILPCGDSSLALVLDARAAAA
jgi:hypothetical protein